MALASTLLSFEGRIGRRSYWLALLGIGLIAGAVILAPPVLRANGIPLFGDWARLWLAVLLLPLLVAAAAVTVKRLHDRDRTGRVLLVLLAACWTVRLTEIAIWYFFGSGPLYDLDNTPGKDAAVQTYGVFGAIVFHGLAFIGGSYFVRLLSSISLLTFDHAGAVLKLSARVFMGLVFVAAGLWFFREVGLRRGTVGTNRFGSDPLDAQPAEGTAAVASPRFDFGLGWHGGVEFLRSRRVLGTAAAAVVIIAGIGAYQKYGDLLVYRSPLELCQEAVRTYVPTRSHAERVIPPCSALIDGGALTDKTFLAEIHLTRAQAHGQLGQTDKAIADYRKVLELAPGNRFATCGLERAAGAVSDACRGGPRQDSGGGAFDAFFPDH